MSPSSNATSRTRPSALPSMTFTRSRKAPLWSRGPPRKCASGRRYTANGKSVQALERARGLARRARNERACRSIRPHVQRIGRRDGAQRVRHRHGNARRALGIPEKVGREINPVGENVFINGVPFTIVGMFQHYQSERNARRGSSPYPDQPTRGGRRRPKPWLGRSGPPSRRSCILPQERHRRIMPLNTVWMRFRPA